MRCFPHLPLMRCVQWNARFTKYVIWIDPRIQNKLNIITKPCYIERHLRNHFKTKLYASYYDGIFPVCTKISSWLKCILVGRIICIATDGVAVMRKTKPLVYSWQQYMNPGRESKHQNPYIPFYSVPRYTAWQISSSSWHIHDDVIKWKHFPRYRSFVRGIHRSPVNSPHKGHWRGALMFSLIWAWTNSWVNYNIPNCMKEVTWLMLCLSTNGHRSAGLGWLPFI